MRPAGFVLTRPLLALGVAIALAVVPSASAGEDEKPLVAIETTEGTIVIELDRARAPKTVENFLKYVDDGFYKDTVFHRVVPNFMIQGGGHAKDTLKEKPTRDPIENEARNGLSNTRGTVAMARKDEVAVSAAAQFFINLNNNSRLDNLRNVGYTVFGKVVEGMDVVDKIAKGPTAPGILDVRNAKGEYQKQPAEDVPVKPVVIKDARRKGKS
jgi:cyclophilin family peptidyl-prolyl cis-trans isomerase